MNEKTNIEEVFQCICGKQFKSKHSLSGHKANCKVYLDLLKHQKESHRLPNGMFKCEECGNEHDGSYGSGRFCSKNCRMIWIGKHSIETRIKNGTFVSPFSYLDVTPRSPYGTWKCELCNIIFETRKQLQQHNHEFHPIPKGKAWNSGKTMKDDKRLCKQSQTLKRLYKTGKYTPVRKGKKHTEEEKDKIRIGFSNYIKKKTIKTRANYNIDSISIIESIGKEHGWNLQHAENGGEIIVLGYWLDAYDKEKNIVLEFDEPYHYDDVLNNILREKDLERQQKIINFLQCEFWRYNESTGVLWKVETNFNRCIT